MIPVHLEARLWLLHQPPYAQVTPGRGWGHLLALILMPGIQTVQALPRLGTEASLNTCLLRNMAFTLATE